MVVVVVLEEGVVVVPLIRWYSSTRKRKGSLIGVMEDKWNCVERRDGMTLMGRRVIGQESANGRCI